MKTLAFPTAVTMAAALLAWWDDHGRKDPALKPWMFSKDWRWPDPDEPVGFYGCWIAEVMHCSTA